MLRFGSVGRPFVCGIGSRECMAELEIATPAPSTSISALAPRVRPSPAAVERVSPGVVAKLGISLSPPYIDPTTGSLAEARVEFAWGSAMP